MNPEQHAIDINAIDADKKKREHVLRLLDELSVNSHVPPQVRLQATQLALGVRTTWRVGGIEPWIKAQYSRYLTTGSIEMVLGVLLLTLLLTYSWPWLMFLAGIAASYGTWMVTRNVKRRQVLASKRLPRA